MDGLLMAREALEPGAYGTKWFEYYSKSLEVVADDGTVSQTRERLPKGTKPKASQVGWVTARVRYRLPTGEYKEMSRSADTKGKAERALDRALAARPAESNSATIQPSWTVERLAHYWLAHRRATGLVRTEGPLQPSSLRQMEVTIRATILGDRKALVRGEWKVVKRAGGIPDLKLTECSRGRLESWLSGLEATGLSTKQARTVLSQMFDLAVKDEAIQGNPMTAVAKPKRRVKTTPRLSVDRARTLRTLVTPEATRKSPKGRMQNNDLAEVVDFALGTGCRIGEILAVRWCDLDLDADHPYVVVCGTLIEARDGLPMYRSPRRKNDGRDVESIVAARLDQDEPDLTLFLPDFVVGMLRARRSRVVGRGRLPRADETVFASAKGTWLQPANIRTRLRNAIKGSPLEGTTPHSLRRAVATAVERELGMEAARHQMGHADPSLTGQVYVHDSMMGPDARDVLSQFFASDWQASERPVVPRMRRVP